MSEAQQHSFTLAAVFTMAAACFAAYRLLKPDQRPQTVQLALSRSAICAVAFGADGFLTGLHVQNYRLQALVVAPINFALIMVVAAICTVQARSLGTVDISTRARMLLRHTPQVFMFTLGLNVAISMIWPVPVLERYSLAPPYYLLNRALVTAAETFFLSVAAFVSWQASGAHEPVKRIRVQHRAFCAAQILLVGEALNTYSVVCFRVFVSNDALRHQLINASLRRETFLSAGAIVLYILALRLYYTSSERTRAITRFSKWYRARRQLDQALWFVEACESSEHLPVYGYIPAAAWELVGRAEQEATPQEFPPQDVQKAVYAFRIFAIATRLELLDSLEKHSLGSILRYQQSMARDPGLSELSWTIATSSTEHHAYSSSSDPVTTPLVKVWEFLNDAREPRLHGEPQWFQLAVVGAAEAQLLPHEKISCILHSRGGAIMERVLRAYTDARLSEELHDTPHSAHRSSQPSGIIRKPLHET